MEKRNFDGVLFIVCAHSLLGELCDDAITYGLEIENLAIRHQIKESETMHAPGLPRWIVYPQAPKSTFVSACCSVGLCR